MGQICTIICGAPCEVFPRELCEGFVIAADKGLDTQCLHARKLKSLHPRTGEEVALECPLPPYFTEVLRRLGPVRGEQE